MTVFTPVSPSNSAAKDSRAPNSKTLLSVTSSEEDDGGDGHIEDDIVIIDDYTFQLRAERFGKNKDGRVYTIIYQVEDDCGNLTIESATVVVPKSQENK